MRWELVCLSSILSSSGNVPKALDPHCPGGWTGKVAGVEALQPWVEQWKIPVNLGPDAAGFCNGNMS